MRLSLRDSIGLHLEYEDRSRFGTMVSGQLQARLKRHFQPAIDALRRNAREAIAHGPSLLAELGLNSSGGFLHSSQVIREELAYPPPDDARPATLRVHHPNARPVRIALPASLVPDLASWLSEWQHGAVEPTSGAPRDLWRALSELDCLGRPRRPGRLNGVATFVGHATVALASRRTKILIDPFLLPREKEFPPGYQPLTHGDFAPDAILITHSHMDHFHIDSLLRLGKDTPIVVPATVRESALAIDMAHRLSELGFTRVRALAWHAETTIGDFRVIALPFYGEQPTTEEVRRPEIRNMGNTYVVEGEGRRYAFLADSGRDHLGDVRSLATAAFERYGALDVLFGGYRSSALYPIQYALSSVPQFLLFTPPSLWGARQQIMNDANALLDTAERWHARYVVPYAVGGAPWYWKLDLGPRVDGPAGRHNMHLDPGPEAVVRAASARSADGARFIPSPVETLVVRPGESLAFDARGVATIAGNEGHLWPYAEPHAVSTMPGFMDEPVGLTRKRVLLRILAGEELERRGLTVATQQIQEMSDDLRRQHGLLDHQQMLDWLERAGLSMAEYCEILFEWQAVLRLEDAMADAIEKRAPAQRAFASMRNAGRS